MSKTRTSITIDEDLKDMIDQQEEVKLSPLVNQFLRTYAANGQSTEAMLTAKVEELKNQRDKHQQKVTEHQNKAEEKQRQIERLEDRLEEYKDNRMKLFEKFHDAKTDSVDLEPSHPAVEKYAQDAGLSPEAFIDQYTEWVAQ